MRRVDEKTTVLPVSRVPRVRHTPPAADEAGSRPASPGPRGGAPRKPPGRRRDRDGVDEYA